MQLKRIFEEIISKFTLDGRTIENSWEEIEKCYTERGRFYHNLNHLQVMFNEVNLVKHCIQDNETLFLSIFYHDIIYNPKAANNEEKSAKVAEKQLKKLHFPTAKIQNVSKQIIATKNHQKTNDIDTNILLDVDLCILGSPWEKYDIYSQQIREEYTMYADSVYRIGRKKALEHLLNFAEIFKTAFFQNKYESQARSNILKELNQL